jgi:hypothetical protein
MGHAQRVVIALRDVVAFAEPAAADEHTVGSLGESPQNERKVHPPRAHETDYPDFRRILQSGNSSQVSGGVSSPVAQEAQYPRSKVESAAHSGVTPGSIAAAWKAYLPGIAASIWLMISSSV